MPVECHFRHIVGFDILPNDGFKHLRAHLGFLAAIYFSLVEVVAVVAVEIAQ